MRMKRRVAREVVSGRKDLPLRLRCDVLTTSFLIHLVSLPLLFNIAPKSTIPLYFDLTNFLFLDMQGQEQNFGMMTSYRQQRPTMGFRRKRMRGGRTYMLRQPGMMMQNRPMHHPNVPPPVSPNAPATHPPVCPKIDFIHQDSTFKSRKRNRSRAGPVFSSQFHNITGMFHCYKGLEVLTSKV